MFKIAVFLVLAIACTANPAQQALQQALIIFNISIIKFINGVYKANNLALPTTILSCLTADQAQSTYDFLTQQLSIATDTQSKDLPLIMQAIFVQLTFVPLETGDCLTSNVELSKLSESYEVIDKETSTEKAVFYVRYNWLETRIVVQEINNYWTNGQFEQAGKATANFMHWVLP